MNNPSTCPHFSLCSGCELGLNWFSPPIWKEALSFFQKNGVKAHFVSEGFNQTRFKAKLAVRAGPEIGLFKKKTHEVLSIPECLVHHPSINEAVRILKKEIIRQGIAPYREDPPSGLLRYIQLFVERSTNRVQLALISTSGELDVFCRSLFEYDLWHSIWLNIHPTASNRIWGETWRLMGGEPFLWQTVHHTPIAFHPAAFSQVHLPLFDQMVAKIESWVHPQETVLELYAGVGAIGLPLCRKAKHLHLVENNPFAHLSFLESSKNISNITYQCADAKEAVLDADLLIVDPPRKGLDPELVQKLSGWRGRLIYVSCHFESYRRDAEQFISAGWHIKEVAGYLLFPGTNHVEILSLLEH